MTHHFSVLGITAMATAALAALFLVHHILFRPRLTTGTRFRLLLGLGVFPAITAAISTYDGLHATTNREFCGGCHVMEAHLADVEDPSSSSLASRHARNPYIGGQNCYICHANYGMFGYPLTKLTGMSHVYYYYLGGYNKLTLEEAVAEIKIAAPFPNSNCMQCHSGKLDSFRNVREHTALIEDLEANTVACSSAGCHGYAHPFSKEAQAKHEAKEHAQR